MARVTVLVAVYNAGAFLRDCLDSLSRQTLHDFQAICIDDASTDGSLAMLNEYARRDARFRVIALDENGGQAHARNVGLGQADGDFVCMLDADDWLSADALEKAVGAFRVDTDCVLFDVVNCYADGRQSLYALPEFDVMPGSEAFRLSLTWQLHGLYMVRSSIHLRYPFDESCRLYSDDNTTRLHYLASRCVRRCDGIYFYRQHHGSATHQVDVRRFDYLRANESMRRQMVQLHVEPALLSEYENHRWLNLVDVYMFYHVHGRQLSAADRHYGLHELRRVWASVDRAALNKKTTAKFGYRPCSSWSLFRLQEWAYFTLRGVLGRNT